MKKYNKGILALALFSLITVLAVVALVILIDKNRRLHSDYKICTLGKFERKKDEIQENKLEEEDEDSKVIVIDPGHQKNADYTKEQKGPDTDIMGTKVSQGTRGEFTKVWEYELNLIVGLKLKELLKNRGYRVYMTRESNDVYITNMQRAKFANDKKADLLLSLHANSLPGEEDFEGILTICMTKDTPYHPELYEKSRYLSDLILEKVVKKTGAKKLDVWERDNLAVLNWCEMPSTMLEMGFMTNKKEDKLLNSAEYQDKICLAIADSLDEYFMKESLK